MLLRSDPARLLCLNMASPTVQVGPCCAVVSKNEAPLGSRFWRVWAAATASNVGDGIVLAALPLLAAELSREPIAVAATTISVRLPWLVFGLFAGVVVDRSDRLRLMITTDAGRAIAFVGIAVIVATENMTLLILYIAVFVIGVLETLFDTAAMSMTPSLVEVEQLDRANAHINGASIAANEFAGPPLGGLLFAVAIAAPFGVNAATFAASVVVLLTVKGTYRPVRAASTSVREDIRVGFSFVWREPVIRSFAIGAGAINLGSTAAMAVLVLHAQDNLLLSDIGFGLLLTAAAVGGVTGALLAPRTIGRFGRKRSVFVSVAVMSIGLAVMGVATDPWVAAVGFFGFGFSGEIWNVVSVTYRQSLTPDELLGRVMSGFRVIAYGAFPVGAVVGGIIASTVDLRASFFFGAVVLALLVPYMVRATRGHDLSPAVAR